MIRYTRAYINDRDYVPYEGIRTHPWLHARDNEGCRYYNFRKSPELIEEVLEDFQSVRHTTAAQDFFKLVRWLNSDESIFETNDCAFDVPHTNTENTHMGKKIECGGRLMFFFRDLPKNVPNLPSDVAAHWVYAHEFQNASNPLPPSQSVRGLRDFLMERLNAPQPLFDWATVQVTLFETRYYQMEVPVQHQFGHLIVLGIWAWGDSNEEALSSFGAVAQSLHGVLQDASNMLKTMR